MWSFIGFFIVGLFIVFMKADTRVKDKQYDAKAKAKYDELTGFCDEFSVTIDEEEKLRRSILESNMSEEMTIVMRHIEDVVGIHPTKEMIVWGYLATKGKLPSLYTINNMHSRNLFSPSYDIVTNVKLDNLRGYNSADLRIARLWFLKWYDEELRMNGFPHKLQSAPLKKGRPVFEEACLIDECETAADRVFFWEPIKQCATRPL